MDWARETLALTTREVAQAVGVTERTVHRWAEGAVAPSSTHREGVERLNELRHLLTEVFGPGRAAVEWLHTPLPLLRGRTPFGELSSGRLDRVIEILAGLHSGAFR